MKRFSFLFTLLTLGLLIIFFEAFLTSCASRASPGGGPKDTLAPVLDTAFPPNFSTGFKSNTIELVFNEYLNLKSPGQQILVSPPLENKPDIQLKGKRILIELEDSLLANTTYTISFGTSITDYTEGNVNKNFKYVFSTGTFIDSLELSGQVYDAYTNEADKDLLVALYEINSDTISLDSLPYKKIPTYYSYLSETGTFQMENLKASRFMIIAFEDQRGDFKLNSGGEKIAFYDSLIVTSDSLPPLRLTSFKSEPTYKFYRARHSGYGQIDFNFSRAVPDIKIERMGAPANPDSVFLDFGENKDTLTYWFTDASDSLGFLISGYEGINDTARLFLRDYQKPALKLGLESAEIRLQDSIVFNSNLPLRSVYPDSFLVFSGKDTFTTKAFIQPEMPMKVFLLPSKRPTDFKISMRPGAVTAWFNRSADSSEWSLKTLNREDLGNLDFTIKGEPGFTYVLQLLGPSKEKVMEKSFTDSTLVRLRNYKPGKYSAQLVVDENGDNRWTSGDFFTRKQPEPILKYSEPIEIRANWDLELEWKIKPQSGKGRDPSKKKTAPASDAPAPSEE